MTTLTTDLPAPRGAGLESSDAVELAPEEARVRQLFRLWLRDGHLHPLIHLIRQFNSERRT